MTTQSGILVRGSHGLAPRVSERFPESEGLISFTHCVSPVSPLANASCHVFCSWTHQVQ
jgi:hypothetical protein